MITGATAGIGEACALTLADAGVHLALVARRGDRLRALAAELGSAGVKVLTHTLDVRDRDRVQNLADQHEEGGVTIDILINNAGLARGLDDLHDGSHEDWDDMIDTNIKGLLNMMRTILPGMIERDSAATSSTSGASPGTWSTRRVNVYCATKYACPRHQPRARIIDLLGTRVRMSSGRSRAWWRPNSRWCAFAATADRAERRVRRRWTRSRPEDIADAVCYVLNTPPARQRAARC